MWGHRPILPAPPEPARNQRQSVAHRLLAWEMETNFWMFLRNSCSCSPHILLCELGALLSSILHLFPQRPNLLDVPQPHICFPWHRHDSVYCSSSLDPLCVQHRKWRCVCTTKNSTIIIEQGSVSASIQVEPRAAALEVWQLGHSSELQKKKNKIDHLFPFLATYLHRNVSMISINQHPKLGKTLEEPSPDLGYHWCGQEWPIVFLATLRLSVPHGNIHESVQHNHLFFPSTISTFFSTKIIFSYHQICIPH